MNIESKSNKDMGMPMRLQGPSAISVVVNIREDVLRLVEAQIASCVDLSPDEMVDAAFLIVQRIEDRLNGKV